MADNHQVQDSGAKARKYGTYQIEVYYAGMKNNIMPTVTTDPNKLEKQAKEAMSATSYCYVAGGAGERATMDANRLAFRQWKLVPRMLRPTTHRDLRVELFGTTYDTPILIAPVGVQQIFHEDKEVGVASIAPSIGVPYILSTASTSTIEEVAAASGPDGQRWFQLYWPQDDEITISLLTRAKNAGFKVLIVTLDTWTLAWRPWDLDHAYVPFFKGTGNAIGFSDPVFRRKFKEKHHIEVEDNIVLASEEWVTTCFSGAAHSWEHLEVIRKNWDGPVLLKGIQHPDDAVKAVECGIDGVVVSNHGGRQLDGAVGSLDMLPEIVEAVGSRCTVLFDSGVRTGVDVIKALCLGAKAVLVGRPWVYGLGIAGKQGAKDALRGLLADLDQSMGLSGIRSIGDCDRSMIRRIQYPGDRHSSN
jgi:lactate 2-monooxygenase